MEGSSEVKWGKMNLEDQSEVKKRHCLKCEEPNATFERLEARRTVLNSEPAFRKLLLHFGLLLCIYLILLLSVNATLGYVQCCIVVCYLCFTIVSLVLVLFYYSGVWSLWGRTWVYQKGGGKNLSHLKVEYFGGFFEARAPRMLSILVKFFNESYHYFHPFHILNSILIHISSCIYS